MKKLISTGSEQYCNSGHCGTYAGKFFRETPAKGQKSYGGYANYWRGPARFVIPIPDNLDPAEAAPMLCGGATVYSPLVQYGAGKTAKDVGVVGLGGLGHFAVIFAKALGANVTVISHSDHKKEDAEKMGATTFISTGSNPSEAVKPHRRSLDLIISTSSRSFPFVILSADIIDQADMPLADYLSLLRPGGHFVTVGAPETDSIPKISPFVFIMGKYALPRDSSLLTPQVTSTSEDPLSVPLQQPSPRC
jgi:alcohol dehydrogenase (NADP+)